MLSVIKDKNSPSLFRLGVLETMDFISEITYFKHSFLWLCVFILFFIYTFSSKPKFNVPPGPRGLPILGNLPFLGSNPHQKLSELGKKYGGILSIYLGREYVVVLTDFEIIKQLLSKTSAADRPHGLFQIMPDGAGLAEKNGPEWIEQRRFTIMEMKNLGFGRSHWEELVQLEVMEVLELLSQTKGEPADVSKILSASISNNVLSLVSNHRLPMGHPERDIIDHGVESFQRVYNPSGIIVHYPKLFKLVVKLGLLRLGQKLDDMMNMNKFVRREIEKIKREGEENHSYISTYLDEIEKNKQLNQRNWFNENNLLGNVQSLIIAGSDTTYVSLLWLLLAMASYPEIQEKVHRELDEKHETIEWVDRQKLPYCLACIMEGQRWRTVVPLNLLHRSNEHIVINGYDISKGTNIMTVLWAVHNDERYWKDPQVFDPERFLTSDGKVIKEPEAYLPFSFVRLKLVDGALVNRTYGGRCEQFTSVFWKRVCLGKTVALIELFQYFQSIMRKFQVLPASDTCKPDLEGFPGLTFQPKRQPLRFVSR